ncbi:MAG: GH36-type glycosyl hydrolase domain-containing protein [Roseateles sp.]|uniref:GH36-type glycosyl hydrolase domain-containing protein n=1 Tax=Roseateles sp. TaxID=1971397 RepID=UPI0040351AB4
MSVHILSNAAGLQAELLSHGGLRRLMCGPALMLNLFLGNELEGGPANVWLRRRDAGSDWRVTPLLGPLSPLNVHAAEGAFEMRGDWDGLALRLQLRLATDEATLFWHLQAENRSGAACDIAPVLVQDIGLAGYGAVRTNEYYVSHYIDLQPLRDADRGVLLAARQNQAQDGQHPWLLAGSLRRAEAFATDAVQVWGPAAREGAPAPALAAGLPSQRLQHEHALVALQDEAIALAPGERAAGGFFLSLQMHHAPASSDADLARLPALLALPEAQPCAPLDEPGHAPAPSLFASAPLLASHDLSAEARRQLFPGERRHEEWRDGQSLSFFTDDAAHVVLRAKELLVQRPHGHILRSGDHLMPDEGALTSTCWMGGVFHSMLTQGHVSINRLLSTQRSLLGLFRTAGLRLFVQLDGQGWQLLGLPSAFEMQPRRCRWLYANDGGLIEVVAEAGAVPDAMSLAMRVLQGGPLRLRASLNLALGGDDGAAASRPTWEHSGDRLRVTPPEGSELADRFPDGALVIDAPGLAIVGDDGRLYDDGVSRGEPLLCLDFAPAAAFALTLRGTLIDTAPPAPQLLALPQWQLAHPALTQLRDILPWYAHNALVHYLSPRGLEQYSGGGWGTRDVCQGPLEMLLALGQTAPVRDLLLRVFSAQNPDGDWPQWFMFFKREAGIRAGDSHGDIVFWPLLGLAQYLIASGDASLLDELAPFHGGEAATLAVHVERALGLIRQRVVPGTGLAAYWHGDWNDSLQPADPALRERLCSAWTVTLHHQMLHTLATAYSQIGRADQAAALTAEAMAVRAEFQRLLVQDDVVAGYALFPEQGERELWIHPRDTRTGLRYSLLPMMHAVIDELFTPEQAATQAALIEQHLKGPDGARLFDAPLPYRGGPSQLFQRAETSAFFGREIGIMYMHAHLRYAQMLAHLGHAEAFLQALTLAHPIGLTDRVPSASRRQANCYYSSSDAAFPDRYVAQAEYGRALGGEVALDGGWRIYSSGPGIALGLVITSLLGLRLEQGALVVDPVMPAVLDGLTVQLALADLRFELTYRVGPRGHGIERVRDDAGREIAATRRPHAYRLGALALDRPAPDSSHRWTIEVG